MYAQKQDDIYVNLYGSNATRIVLEKGWVDLEQQTEYPFAGQIRLEVNPDRKRTFSLLFRIPTWMGGQFVPGDLYDFQDSVSTGWELIINGELQSVQVEKGFARIKRTWRPGDVVELGLPMPVRQNLCHPAVEANRGRVAFTRGPLVYCGEGIDQLGDLFAYSLDMASGIGGDIFFLEEKPLAGIPGIQVAAKMEGKESFLRLIPYYAWNNRGNGAMRVWFPVEE
jgi:DUF1680 family protein